MKDIKVVIGANFGDEGKGLMTSYFASRANNGIVVRANGGAQAAHTVMSPTGKLHVFGHIGSGTFSGLPTYLSSFFVVNPLIFLKEYRALEGLGFKPSVFVDKGAMVTTLYDVMLNQMLESKRGEKKHGSCGIGFNETIVRNTCKWDNFYISVSDLLNLPLLRMKLDAIHSIYMAERMKDLDIYLSDKQYSRYAKLLGDKELLIDIYLEDIKQMLNLVTITDLQCLNKYDDIIFEGAQGLLLDQSHYYYPHVTRSNTGFKNVASILKDAALTAENLEITYITRSYMSRHGAGPFPTECPKPYPAINDDTNPANEYQGSIRYGLLNIDALGKQIEHDLVFNAADFNYKTSLAVTCLDQIDDRAVYIQNNENTRSPINHFLHNLRLATHADHLYGGNGRTYETVRNLGAYYV